MRDLLLILSGAFAASIAWMIAIYGEKILRRFSWPEPRRCAQCATELADDNAVTRMTARICPICMVDFCSETYRRTHARRAARRLPEDMEGCSVEPRR